MEKNTEIENNKIGKLDILNRKPFIDNVCSLLNSLSDDKRGCVFAIDGDWGSGKSFVLEKIEEELEMIQREGTNDDRFLLFHYNCWQYDYYPEPAVAIVSAMLDKSNIKANSEIWKKAKNIIKTISNEFVKNRIGIDVVEIANAALSQNLDFDEWFSFKKTLDSTREKIKELAEYKTILIIVDELDRCLPQYAIKVIERLHHLFSGLENVIVVLAIDKSQLDHSIGEIFGQKIDTDKYLKKFIDFYIKLDYGNIQDDFWDNFTTYFSMFKNIYFHDVDDVRNIMRRVLDSAEFDIREKEKIIEKAITIHKLVCDEECDYSIMLFEIFVLIFVAARNKSEQEESLDLLASINSVKNKKVIEYIGENLYNTLKNTLGNVTEKMQIDTGSYEEFYECKTTVSVTFHLLNSLYNDKKIAFIDLNVGKYNKEIEMCKKFEQYRKMLR